MGLPTVIAATLTFLCETFLRHGFAGVQVSFLGCHGTTSMCVRSLINAHAFGK